MSYMKFIMIGLLLREALDRLRVRLNMYLVKVEFKRVELLMEDILLYFSLHQLFLAFVFLPINNCNVNMAINV